MLQSCTKFRVLAVLLFLVLVNIVLFRNYFHHSFDLVSAFRAFSGFDVSPAVWGNSTRNTTSQSGTSSWGHTTTPVWGNSRSSRNTTSRSGTTSWGHTTTPVWGNSTSLSNTTSRSSTTSWGHTTTPVSSLKSTIAQTASQALRLGGAGRPMEAFGKIVMPQANVAPPWKTGNSSTLCPLSPPNLVGPLATYQKAPSWTEIVRLNPGLEPGGHYQPGECKARHRVAIIVPYRDREEHLRVLLYYLHPMLIRQQLDYFVLVVELAQPTRFNRGMLLNIGAVEALGLWDVQCFIFHDVDLLPENDHNLYTCPETPRHMSAAVDKFQYRLPYSTIFGGVSALLREHLFKVNGYSNAYFGWGGEDDDLRQRINTAGLKVIRYSMQIARYRMIKHNRDKKNEPNPKRIKLLQNFKKRQRTDGLNSLQYQVQKVEFRPGYTWILVSVNQDQVMKALS